MQRVEKNTRVTLSYTIRSWSGELLEEAPHNNPIGYIHGYGQILPKLERALEGAEPGETRVVKLRAEDAYGNWYEDYLRNVPKSALAHIPDLEVGVEVELRNGRWEEVSDDSPAGSLSYDPPPQFTEEELLEGVDEEREDEPTVFEVTEILEETVLLDGNHYLAGQDLVFEMRVLKAEPASIDEIERSEWDSGQQDDSEDYF